MEVVRKGFSLEFTGPLPTRDMPEAPLYDCVLEVSHDAQDAAEAVVAALSPLLGTPQVRRLPLLGTRIAWKHAKWPVEVRVKAGLIEVRSLQRLKGKRLTHLCAALAKVPGARDLVLQAETPAFVDDFHDITACSPCQAAALRRA